MTGYRVTAAATWMDAWRLLRCRNACREYMTRNRARILVWQQVKWWRGHRTRYRPFLMWVGKTYVGFGMITDGQWLTGALLPGWRGRGLGRALFQELIARCLCPKLEVLTTNAPAIGLYLALGFTETGDENGVLTMELSRFPSSSPTSLLRSEKPSVAS